MQMPHMQRHVRALRYGQEDQESPPTRSPQRLPARRRPARPLQLDTAAFDNGHIPRNPTPRAADRDIRLSADIRQAVPVLGVRGGLPGLDEGQYSAGQQQERVWAVDVRGAQCC